MTDQKAQISQILDAALRHADEALEEVASCGRSIEAARAAWAGYPNDPAGYLRALGNILDAQSLAADKARAALSFAQEAAGWADRFDSGKAQEICDRHVHLAKVASMRAQEFAVAARESAGCAQYLADQYEIEVNASKEAARADAVAL